MIRISENTYSLRPLQYDTALQYGQAVFETILVLRRPVFWSEHCSRLNRSLEELAIREKLNPDWLRLQVDQLNLHDCVLKLIVSAENIILQTRQIPRPDQYDGFKLTLRPDPRPRDPRLLHNKTCNYLANILAWQDAAADGFADALFYTAENQITECSRSNIFWIRGTEIHTPSSTCGLLPGVVRGWLLNRFPVICGRYEKNDIMQAETVLATNSVMGVCPVEAIDNKVFAPSETGSRIIFAWEQEVLARNN